MTREITASKVKAARIITLAADRRAIHGFSLLELLILVAMLGIFAAIASSNTANLIQRACQKRTMADMKALDLAVTQFHTDRDSYPSLPFSHVCSNANSCADGLYLPGNNLRPYLLTPIAKDCWWDPQSPSSHIFWYSTQGLGTHANYMICSMARNDAVDSSSGSVPAGCTSLPSPPYVAGYGTTFDCDITMVNGKFIQQPLGRQRAVFGC